VAASLSALQQDPAALVCAEEIPLPVGLALQYHAFERHLDRRQIVACPHRCTLYPAPGEFLLTALLAV